MIVWHVGADPVPENVNGVNTTVWTVAKAQAALGHEVVLLLGDEPLPASTIHAERGGIRILHVPAGRWSFDNAALGRALEARPPQIVHMHSVFVPRQIGVARLLRQWGIPYIITPNGGIDPNILARGRLKKSVYSLLLEKPRFRDAAAVTAVLPMEIEEIDAYAPGHRFATPVIPNPIDTVLLRASAWKGPNGTPRLVYLGRFDIQHKGIDRLVQIAALLPEMEFRLYGPQDALSASLIAELKPPRNVFVHPPVHGAAKIEALANATAYLQTSRWEAFGVSLAEAMFLGVPCAVMSSMKIADSIRSAKAGLVLPEAPSQAAQMLARWLGDTKALISTGQRARDFAAAHFSESIVAASYLRVYEDVLRSRNPLQSRPAALSPNAAT